MDGAVASPGQDPQLFEQTLLPHMDAAYNLARWLLRNEHDAEDAVQEAFVRAFQSFARFRGGDGRAWLLTIVRNLCYTRLRRQIGKEPAEPFDEALHGATNEAADSAERLRREAQGEQLQAALEKLPEEFREVLVLHELEELSYKEIATVIGVPVGTVMSRLSRARQRLQRTLTAGKESPHGL